MLTAAYIFTGLVIGSALCYLLLSRTVRKLELDQQLKERDLELLSTQLQAQETLCEEMTQREKDLDDLLQHTRSENIKMTAEIQFLKKRALELTEEQKLQREGLTEEFQNLANKVLLQSGDQIKTAHEKQLKELLSPFRENLTRFEKTIDQRFVKETEDRASLQGEIKSLIKLNQNMSQEARNLTQALKGDNKAQGNWGEIILERVLEVSGLQKGIEYEIQETSRDTNNQLLKPDVVIQLPEDKHLIIDSKVSLLHYEALVNNPTIGEEELLTKRLIQSVKEHIRGLSDKNYPSGKDWNAPDFVLMFMPVEAAFGTIMQGDSSLFQYAWDKKIVIVGPSTLLATLRTVANIWKHEKQHQHASLIAQEAGNLYDKFVGFIEDLQKVRKGIDQSNAAFDQAMNKLQHGKGNLIRRVEKIKELGAKTSKALPKNLTQDEDEDND